MIWLAFAAGWILGSVSLYLYMIVTAREPKDDQCVDCALPDCRECPYEEASDNLAAKRAA